jgi:hypothetical protein
MSAFGPKRWYLNVRYSVAIGGKHTSGVNDPSATIYEDTLSNVRTNQRLCRTTLFGSWFTALQEPATPGKGDAALASPSPCRLVGPYKLSFEPNGSPLFPLIPLVTCRRYEPREHPRPLALARPEILPSPLSDRVGYSNHVRFRGYFPVHCIPACNLPVYASQWPLPDTTQDSVRGCSLGFTAAAISSGRVQRAFKAQRSSNRTCSSPASGSRTRLHAFTHGTSCPSRHRRTSPKCP